jgi:ATP-dependent Clp protease ATP-binding subunit ClpC
MFEKFSEQARRVTALAQQNARVLNHTWIGTEHLLLGLLDEADSIAAQVLTELGLTVSGAREQIIDAVGRGKDSPVDRLPFTPRAKKVLELALRESLHHGAEFIRPEHILLALIREADGVAAQILGKLGGGLPRVRQRVLKAMTARGGVPLSEEGPGPVVLQPVRSSRGQRMRLISELTAVVEENDHLHAEVDRLRGLLREHGIKDGVPPREP